jgi:hypothetical protein
MGLIPTGICCHCERQLTFHIKAAGWQDDSGWFSCKESPTRQHHPVDPVEGVDY